MRLFRAVLPALLCLAAPAAAQTPADLAEELLAADRAFSESARQDGLLLALDAMFAHDVILPAPGGEFVHGREAALALLRTNPANEVSQATWTPIRTGVSADGLHGFTFGTMAIDRPDATRAYAKYMTYWVRGPEGWRARAWKRAPLEAEIPADPMAPSLPAALVVPDTDPAVVRAHEESLAETERAFSRDAQAIGLGPAFVRYGSADAVNMGPASGPYLIGADAIGRAVGEGEPGGSSSVSWGPDEAVIAASSGDLGITFGRIRSNDPAHADRPPFPFFTIWRRASPDAPWRYVAE